MMEEMNILKSVPVFGELDEQTLRQIVSLCVRKKYKKGGVILMEEETGAALFIIISGKVKVVRTDDGEREALLSILNEHEFFGEMALLDGLKRSASVVAMEKAELLMIHRSDFLKLLTDNPTVSIALLHELTSRLRKADTQIKSLSLKDAAGRVASVILQLADEIGMFRKGRVEIDELPLQQDLANMAGTSRETISRMLHKFAEDGAIELTNSKLIINDYEKFKNIHL